MREYQSVFPWIVAALLAILFLIKSAITKSARREEMERVKREHEEMNQMKSNFISIASHQLRAPLGGVRGYLSMVRDGDFGPTTRKQKEIIDLNMEVLGQTLRVIEMFLDVTKLEIGKIGLSRKPTDLGEIVEGVRAELALLAARKGLLLRIRAPKRLRKISIDPEKMRHVVYNLVDNAIKYTEKGTIEITLEKNGGAIECRVKDAGIGIDAKEVPKLFSQFVRAGGGFRVSHGSGLGLYITKTFVEAHGGEVFVLSEGTGKGSTFGFRLPIRGRGSR